MTRKIPDPDRVMHRMIDEYIKKATDKYLESLKINRSGEHWKKHGDYVSHHARIASGLTGESQFLCEAVIMDYAHGADERGEPLDPEIGIKSAKRISETRDALKAAGAE